MTASHLLRFYPRSWRNRYGDEFLATIGDGPLRVQQTIDIIAGAIDAWVATDVRRATRAQSRASISEGDPMTARLSTICSSTTLRYTKRDGLIGAAVMLTSTLALSIGGVVLRRRGVTLAAAMMLSNAFMVSLVASMPFWLLKGQSWRAQAVLVGGIISFLVGISYLATMI